ncbi:MAG: DUF3084 domain-containing protein [Bacillota bacterium]
MYGAIIIILLIALSGFIAYLGDQIGMKVGKKRISIFGLRPKYSSIIITVVTGILIAALSIGILLTTYGTLREAVFNINQVVLKLENLNEDLEELQSQKTELESKISNLQEELKMSQDELDNTKNELNLTENELKETENNLNDTENELKNTENELKNTESELTTTKDELAKAEKDIKDLKKNREDLQKRVAELKGQRTELEKKVGSLNDQIKNLTEDYEVASELANRLGEDVYYYMREDIVYQKGDTIYSEVIDGGQSEDETIAALNEFLTKANEKAKEREIKKDESTGMALELQTEDILYTARVLYNMEKGQQAIVSLVSSVNVPKNEWLKANFVLNKNFVVFEKGDLIASKIIDARNTTSDIDNELRNVLKEVNQKAIRNGLLTDSEGQVGSIDFVNFYQIVERVKSKDKKVEIKVHAKEDIWRNNRLGKNIDFSIEIIDDEGKKEND